MKRSILIFLIVLMVYAIDGTPRRDRHDDHDGGGDRNHDRDRNHGRDRGHGRGSTDEYGEERHRRPRPHGPDGDGDYPRPNQNQNQGQGGDPTRFCLNLAAESGGECPTFQSCCARRCGGDSYNVQCTVLNDQMNGQCTCTGGDSGSFGNGGGGGGDGDYDRPRRTTTPSWSRPDDDMDPYRPSDPDPPRRTTPPSFGGNNDGGSGQCGRPAVPPRGPQERIVGGTESTPHSWPWQASLQIRGQHICGASLIDARHIVTAAHCFQNSQNPGDYKVVLGLHDRRSPGSAVKTVGVQRILKHPNYNDPNEHSNDVAVLTLSTSVQSSSSISPVCLPESDVQAGKRCIVTGWGETEGTGNNLVLLQVEVPIVSSQTCNDRQHYRGAIDDTMICAGKTGSDSCQGDSGGPMVCARRDSTWELQGVVSWGMGCADQNRPGVYTRVTAVKSWIEQNLD